MSQFSIFSALSLFGSTSPLHYSSLCYWVDVWGRTRLVPRDRPATAMTQIPSHFITCSSCDFFVQIGPTPTCNAAEPDAVLTADPSESHGCKHWEQKNAIAAKARNQATQQRIVKKPDPKAATHRVIVTGTFLASGRFVPTPGPGNPFWQRLEEVQLEDLQQYSANTRADAPQIPTVEEVREGINRMMGVPGLTSTPNSEPNPFLVSEAQLAWARRIERDCELVERSPELVTEAAAFEVRREEEIRRLEIERQARQAQQAAMRFQAEEARIIDELVNGHWDVAANEPVIRGGGRSGRHRDRISVPRYWEQGISASELREKIEHLPPVHGVPIGQVIEMYRGLRPADFITSRSMTDLYDRDQVVLRFVLERVDGAPVWVYQGKVIMD